MKHTRFGFRECLALSIKVLVLLLAAPLPAAVLYVDLNSPNSAAPFSSWGIAATNIQDAIDAASDGDQILVTNGVYQSGGRVVYGSLTNRVAINKAVSVLSVNGPAVTTIQGNYTSDESTARCAYLADGAALTGFTLTLGATRNGEGDLWTEQSGGGAWCESTNSFFTNCIITGNLAWHGGGGLCGGTLQDCLVSSNQLRQGFYDTSGGAGANGSVLNHCTVIGNYADKEGGGARDSFLNFCVVTGNSAGTGGGISGGALFNCLLTTNRAFSSGGGGAWGALLNNCTLVENSAYSGGGSGNSTLNNCILYYNHGYGYDNHIGSSLNRCCSTPDGGQGNFTNAPLFVDYPAGNFHLQSGSFCINAGDNAAATETLDLDGNLRIVGAYVDVGAYEYQAVAPVPIGVSFSVAYTNLAIGFVNTLTGDVDGYPSASFWDFGDSSATVSNQLSVSHAYASPGNYTVTFTAVNDDHPAGVSAIVVIHVLANPISYVLQANPTPVAPFISWAAAATNIQDAIDSAFAGGVILVSNGVYETGSGVIPGFGSACRVAVNRPLNVRSVNGPAVTVIKGYRGPLGTNDPNSMRCVGLVTGSSLTGFTLTNGCSGLGGGVLGATFNVGVTNCLIMGNSSKIYGGGGSSCTFEGCIFGQNTAGVRGGAASLANLDNCLIVSNWSGYGGGGLYGGTAKNCVVVGNSSPGLGAGTDNVQAYNSVIYYNSNSGASANGTNYNSGTFSYCCTTPFPFGLASPDTFTNVPAFANAGAGDFRLTAASPCINAGINSSVVSSSDLAGQPRIQFGRVDVGAYEFQTPIHYARITNASPSAPYTNWFTAATNIQDAVDAAAPGEFVVVSNGVYQFGGRAVFGLETNRVVLTNAVTVLSVSGSQATTIAGAFNTRGALVGSNSVLVGFTITNGQARANIGDAVKEQSGGGIWCEAGGVLSNCFVICNHSSSGSGSSGGGIYGGSIWNTVISNNYAAFGGAASQAILNNCIIVSNSAPSSPPYGYGGGLYQCSATNCTLTANGWGYGTTGGGAYHSRLVNCTLITNLSTYGGGGASFCLLVNCTLTRNVGQGGATDSCTNYYCVMTNNLGSNGGGTSGGYAYDCLIVSNIAKFQGGGSDKGTLYDCTLVGNTATNSGGGLNGSTAYNCIVYYNSSPGGSNWSGATLFSCCTLPTTGATISQTISNAPVFVNAATGNLRLQSNSPCINSGTNFFAIDATDLDGNPRITGGTVDFGAYEFQSPASTLPYFWLAQYGLPINSASDSADPDADGASNLQEWGAGTVPTNALSALKMLGTTQAVVGVSVTWQSVFSRKYWIERSTNLTAVPAFRGLQSNITAFSSITTYTDSNAVGAGPYFYRVGAQ